MISKVEMLSAFLGGTVVCLAEGILYELAKKISRLIRSIWRGITCSNPPSNSPIKTPSVIKYQTKIKIYNTGSARGEPLASSNRSQ